MENAEPPSGMTIFGSLVTYVCRSGYSPDGTDTAVCTMMGWSNVPKCQGTENTCGLTLTVWLLSPVHINFKEKDHRCRMAEWRATKKMHYTCHVHEGSRGGGTGPAGLVLAGPRCSGQVMNIQNVTHA